MDLKRLLINSMNQRHNCYPNSKADVYTMFCKYVPEIINNNNNLMTMYDSHVMGVSLYQRATPIYGYPVAGENGITKDMITFCKCGCCGHI